jgi:hypothetical protein
MLFQNLERTVGQLEQFLSLILNDPDLYSHTVYNFFDSHPLFSIFPDVQRTLNTYRLE